MVSGWVRLTRGGGRGEPEPGSSGGRPGVVGVFNEAWVG